MLDDIYFEKINKNAVIHREVYTLSKQVVKPFNIIKFITFTTKEKNSTKQIYELIELLRKNTIILVTFFNPKNKECTLLFISNKDDSKLEQHINNFLEVENM